MPTMKNIIYNDLETIAEWDDGTKTIVSCNNKYRFDREASLAMAMASKYLELNGSTNCCGAGFIEKNRSSNKMSDMFKLVGDGTYFYVGNSIRSHMPTIEKVMYNDLATIVKWDDGSKTVVHCYKKDDFDQEVGLAMAIARKYFEFNGHSSTPRADFMRCVKSATVYSEPSEQIDEESLFAASKDAIDRAIARFNNRP